MCWRMSYRLGRPEHIFPTDPPPFDETTLSKFVIIIKRKAKQRETNSLRLRMRKEVSFLQREKFTDPAWNQGKCLPTYHFASVICSVRSLGLLGRKRIYFTLMSWTNEILLFLFHSWQIWGDTHLKTRPELVSADVGFEIRWNSSEGRLKP